MERNVNSISFFSLAADLWMFLGAYWLVSMLQRKEAKKKESLAERLKHFLPVLLALGLLFWQKAGFGWLGARFVPQSSVIAAIGLVLTAAGVGLAIWARWHLGKNWSGSVTIHSEHELIRTGPYKTMRHPIYTGILLAMAGTAVVLGEVRGVIAFGLTFFTFWWKARKEEAWLAQEFGAGFEAHTKHTGMFLPRML
jgi:protein-S-isoprenylcysteine O-methyltransferase Ste14